MKLGFLTRKNKILKLISLLSLLVLLIQLPLSGMSKGTLGFTEIAKNAGASIAAAIMLHNLLGSEPVILTIFGGGVILIALFLRRRLKRRSMVQEDLKPQSIIS